MMSAAATAAEAEAAAEAAAAYKAMTDSPVAYLTKLAAEVDLAAARMAGVTAADEKVATLTGALAGDVTTGTGAMAVAHMTTDTGAMPAHTTPTGAVHVTSTTTMADPAVATTGTNIEEPTAAPVAAAAMTAIPVAAAETTTAMDSATAAAAAAPGGFRMQKLAAAAAARNHKSKLKCVGVAGVVTKVALRGVLAGKMMTADMMGLGGGSGGGGGRNVGGWCDADNVWIGGGAGGVNVGGDSAHNAGDILWRGGYVGGGSDAAVHDAALPEAAGWHSTPVLGAVPAATWGCVPCGAVGNRGVVGVGFGAGRRAGALWHASATAVPARGMHTSVLVSQQSGAKVMLRVGDVGWVPLTRKGGWKTTTVAADILDAAANSKLFAVALKDVDLLKCKVRVLKTAAGGIPTDVDLRNVVEVGLLASLVEMPAVGRRVWIQVELPPAPGTTAWLYDIIQDVVPLPQRKTHKDLLIPTLPTTTPLLNGMQLHPTDGVAVDAAAAAREEAIAATTAHFVIRRDKRLRKLSGTIPDRFVDPIVATQSAPGGGKTTFLATMACYSAAGKWPEYLCKDAGMREMLEDSVPLFVTYNNNMDASAKYDMNDQAGFAMRILYSFFVQANGVSFSVFCDSLIAKLGTIAIVPSNAMECCFLALAKEKTGRTGVLLLIDEIVKLFETKPDTEILKVIGGLLTDNGKLNVVMTTLDTAKMWSLQTKSGREVHYVPLQPLKQAEAESMLRRVMMVDKLDDEVRVAISDACGHPRTLEYVGDAWKALQEARKPVTLSAIREEVQNRLPPIELWHLAAALDGRNCRLKDNLPGDTVPFQKRITEGYFVNNSIGFLRAATTRHLSIPVRAIPHITIFQMLSFRRDFASAEGAEHPLVLCIDKLLANPLDTVTVAQNRGAAFEEFIAAWLLTRVAVHEEMARARVTTAPLTISRLFHLDPPKEEQVDNYLDVSTVKVLSECIVTFGNRVSSITAHPDKKIGQIAGDVMDKLGVHTFINNNPGVDVVLVLPGARVGIELKFSHLGAKPVLLTDTEVGEKLTTLCKELGTDRLPLEGSIDLLILIAVNRQFDSGDGSDSKTKLTALREKHCIVLALERAIMVLGPSLSQRGMFLLEGYR